MSTPEARITQAWQMRAVTIQFLRQLEDELIEAGVLEPDGRSCLTRQERRALEQRALEQRHDEARPMNGV